MKGLLFVMIGGGVGAGLRYGVGIASTRIFGIDFPWGTVICNVAGSLAMGFFVGAMALGLMGDSDGLRMRGCCWLLAYLAASRRSRHSRWTP